MGYYSRAELEKMNFKYLGDDVMISTLARIYNPEMTEIGDGCRIDDFCVLMGKIVLGKYIHLALYTHIGGTNQGVYMEDHSECAYRCAIITHSSDYTLETLHCPCVPAELKKGRSGPVHIGKYVLIGYDCLIMPGVTIEAGCSIGAFSYVNKDLKGWHIYDGKPIKCVGRTKKESIIDNERKFLSYK